MSPQSTSAEPVLLPIGRGAHPQRHCWWHQPIGRAPQHLIVHVHGFAEELNKGRRMSARMARLLAEHGCAVLRVDLLGCGDSAGDSADATWSDWVADVRAACEWSLQEWHANWGSAPTPQCWLWGLRAGCLVANDAAARLSGSWHRLWWQPAGNGGQVLQQFLRLESAAGFLGKAAAPKGPPAKARLAAGECVEVAGYSISPALATGLDAARLRPPAEPVRLVWIDVDTQGSKEPTPAAALTLEAWRTAGCEVQHQAVTGPMFWQTTEVTEAPELLTASLQAVLRLETAALAAPT